MGDTPGEECCDQLALPSSLPPSTPLPLPRLSGLVRKELGCSDVPGSFARLLWLLEVWSWRVRDCLVRSLLRPRGGFLTAPREGEGVSPHLSSCSSSASTPAPGPAPASLSTPAPGPASAPASLSAPAPALLSAPAPPTAPCPTVAGAPLAGPPLAPLSAPAPARAGLAAVPGPPSARGAEALSREEGSAPGSPAPSEAAGMAANHQTGCHVAARTTPRGSTHGARFPGQAHLSVKAVGKSTRPGVLHC